MEKRTFQYDDVMFDLVISGGDSFTFGSELSVDDMHPNENCWANLVAQRIGKRHINTAKGGRSNSFISRRVLKQIENAESAGIKNNKIFVQIMWTFSSRHEVALGYHHEDYDSPWAWITQYSSINETDSDWFRQIKNRDNNYKTLKQHLNSKFQKNKSLGIVDYAKAYNKVTQGTVLNNTYVSLKDILLLQSILKSKNIPYLFLYNDYHCYEDLCIRPLRDEGIEYIKMYRNLIDFDKWFTFPGAYGFKDWAKENNYKFATTHPLHKAHKDAAELVYNYIKTNIGISN